VRTLVLSLRFQQAFLQTNKLNLLNNEQLTQLHTSIPGIPEGRLQLDVDIPQRLDHRGPLRAVAVLQRQRQVQGAAEGLRRQQDQGRRVVRLQLRR